MLSRFPKLDEAVVPDSVAGGVAVDKVPEPVPVVAVDVKLT